MQEEDKILLQLFGNKLKKLREEKYESLNKFAFDNTLLTSATISRIENANVDFKFTTVINASSNGAKFYLVGQ